ncbi:hypothetical protein GALL_63470 [mine drainage metagenome]|uniref:DUF4286 domain-containing protein n=1 Tax=mine drainage metagenome TaxID=410659 RepID=A0A1J5T780_9ZZZZ
MIIYNVTIKVEPDIHEAWVDWMKTKHIPEIMNTGCFTKFQFVKVLETDESDGFTYATQYYAATKEDYQKYIDQFAATLRQDAMKTWGNKFAGFRSLMQVVH